MAQPVDRQKTKGINGQALYEAVILMPLLMIVLSSFLTFIYDQLWTQIVEEIVHETILCEETLGGKLCLGQANLKANRYKLFGMVIIHKPKPNEYMAEQFVWGKKFLWKTLIIRKKETPPK